MSDVINSGVTNSGRDWTEGEWEEYLNSGRTPDDVDMEPVDYKVLFREVSAELKLARGKVVEFVNEMEFVGNFDLLVNKLKELFKIGG